MVTNEYMSPSTYEYRRVINNHLSPSFANYPVDQITAQIIRELINTLDVTQKTIINYLTPLRNMFEDALNGDLIKQNPFEQIAVNKLTQVTAIKSKFLVEPFNEVEKQMIINAVEGQMRNIIQFSFWSGLRTSELIALKWIDINFKNNTAHIKRAKVCNIEKSMKTKSGIRDLLLLPKAVEALKNQIKFTQHDEYVFHNPNTNRAWTNSERFSHTWIRILSKLDIKYRNCYQMRHTYASTLLSNGENPAWIATQMWHVDVEMVFKRYGRWISKNNDNSYRLVGSY